MAAGLGAMAAAEASHWGSRSGEGSRRSRRGATSGVGFLFGEEGKGSRVCGALAPQQLVKEQGKRVGPT
jgi:hypothetical protein